MFKAQIIEFGFTIHGQTAELSAYLGHDLDVVVPSQYKGYPVNAIGRQAFAGSRAKRVILPSTVTRIESSAFINSGLEEIELPSGLTYIGNNALSTHGLSSIEIPNSVSHIGDGAFSYCKSLTTINIPSAVTSLGESPFKGCTSLKTIRVSPNHPTFATIDGVLYFKPEKSLVFFPNINIPSYNIPNGVLKIEAGAFSENASLRSVTIPKTVKSIGEDAFYKCIGLRKLEIPDSVDTIGYHAIWGCGSLESVSIPDSLADVCGNNFSGFFAGCDSLKTINVSVSHPTLASIDGVLFSKVDRKLVCYPPSLGATSYSVPYGITSIDRFAFKGNKSLMTINIPDSVKIIGMEAFEECRSLISVRVPASVQYIEEGILYACNESAKLIVERGSFAADYAEQNGINYIYPDSLDWLK